MRKFSIAASVAVLAMFLAGCGSQPGASTVTWSRGRAPLPLVAASDTGTYKLFASDSPTAMTTVLLKRGDMYGFRMDDATARVVAVANGQDIPLQKLLATSYYWKMEVPTNK